MTRRPKEATAPQSPVAVELPMGTAIVRTFEQLNEAEQEKAVDLAYNTFLSLVVRGAIRFSDEKNGDDIQARIDAAFAKAEAMRTPWFTTEYVHEAAGDDLRGFAQCDAEDALYVNPETRVVQLPLDA